MRNDSDSQTPQYITVLNYLLLGCRLTSLEALKYFGIISFPKRITQIFQETGIEVKRERITVNGRFGEKHVNVYWIENNKLTL